MSLIPSARLTRCLLFLVVLAPQGFSANCPLDKFTPIYPSGTVWDSFKVDKTLNQQGDIPHETDTLVFHCTCPNCGPVTNACDPLDLKQTFEATYHVENNIGIDISWVKLGMSTFGGFTVKSELTIPCKPVTPPLGMISEKGTSVKGRLITHYDKQGVTCLTRARVIIPPNYDFIGPWVPSGGEYWDPTVYGPITATIQVTQGQTTNIPCGPGN